MPLETVWDFTQNYDHRSSWDASVLSAIILSPAPNRVVRLELKGNTAVTFVYKLDDRPRKTTLVGQDIRSPFIEKCGGSWHYEAVPGGTRWEQTNTVVFKNFVLYRLLKPLTRRMFERQTHRAMLKAKRILETRYSA